MNFPFHFECVNIFNKYCFVRMVNEWCQVDASIWVMMLSSYCLNVWLFLMLFLLEIVELFRVCTYNDDSCVLLLYIYCTIGIWGKNAQDYWMHCTLCQMISCSLHFWKHDLLKVRFFSFVWGQTNSHLIRLLLTLLINLELNEIACRWLRCWFLYRQALMIARFFDKFLTLNFNLH